MAAEEPSYETVDLTAGVMPVVGQTHLEASNINAELLKPKQTLNIGCCNFRTMFQTGKLAQVNKQFRNCKIDLSGLSEVRGPGNGSMTTERHTLLYSGRKDSEHQAGVAILRKGVDVGNDHRLLTRK